VCFCLSVGGSLLSFFFYPINYKRFKRKKQCAAGRVGTKTMTKNKADGLERGSHQSTGGV